MASILTHDDYTIGWICALPVEMAAARAMLDEIHPPLSQPHSDGNSYILGRIHTHNVAIACLPGGVYGTTSAAVVGQQMLATFRRIRVGLMVGIGGGVPNLPLAEIRLGDVVVSYPTAQYSGVIAYDYGKTLEDGAFMHTGSLNKPPPVLLTAVGNLRASYILGKGRVAEILQATVTEYKHFAPPDSEDASSSKHLTRGGDPVKAVRVHHGTIASANQVMKDATTRDRLARDHGILCFEMEAAGLMDHFPCLVIRGICDYADASKSKEWQAFAAASAAAYSKELLELVPALEVEKTGPAPKDVAAENRKPIPFGILNAVFPAELSFLGSLTTDMSSPRQNYHAPVKPPAEGQYDLVRQDVPHSLRLPTESISSLFSLLYITEPTEKTESVDVDRSSSCILDNSTAWFDQLVSRSRTRKWIEKQVMNSIQTIYLVVGFRSLWRSDISASHEKTSLKNNPLVGEVVYSVQYRAVQFGWFRRRDVGSVSLEKGICWKSLYTDRGEDDEEAQDWLQVRLGDGATVAETGDGVSH
ncbi:nucleoside phosphorylase domain-containing protein [Aspergillus aurantiobrunneus]